MTPGHRSLRRALAGVHAGLAVLALGLGNAALGGQGGGPAVLHLVLGALLAATAYGLWRGDTFVRRLAVLNGLVGALAVAGLLTAAFRTGGTAVFVLLGGAVAFLALEAAAYALLSLPSDPAGR